jgi:two-component system, OmpR family, sensor histidine kinase ArlS
MSSIFTWRKTISGKLTILYATLFIIVLLVLNGAALLGLRYFVLNNARNSLDNTMEFVLGRFNTGFTAYEQDIVEEISKSEPGVYFRILLPNRTIVAQSNLLNEVEMPVQQGYNRLKIAGRSFVYRSSLILIGGIFRGYLQAVRETTLEYHFLRVLSGILLTTSLVGSIGAIFVGNTVTRKTLKPISLITDTARKISISDLGQRLKIEGPEDELSDLTGTFNSMLERLEVAFHKQQDFVSDASHELRTPISVIQGYINLLDRWGKEEVKVRDEAIEAIKGEADNMKRLVENLLFLARGDSDKIEIKKDFFTVNELIEELIRESKILAKDIKIDSHSNAAVSLYGDRKLIKQMLRAFVDNSLKYTPTGGEIIIDSSVEGEWLKLVVADTGMGISEEDLPHIFDRFYRVDKARSNERGSTGLGLAIAKWIIENHQGKVRVESRVGEGTRVSVYLPVDSGNVR